MEKYERRENHNKKTNSTADNLSEGSNTSLSYTTINKNSMKSLKKIQYNLSDWDLIDDPLEPYDIFHAENLEELTQKEMNKYQGLSGFVKIIEQNEGKSPRSRNSFSNIFSPKQKKNLEISIQPTINGFNNDAYIIEKKNEFTKAFPIQPLIRSKSAEILQNVAVGDYSNEKNHKFFSYNDLEKAELGGEKFEKPIKIRRFGPWGEIWEDKEVFLRKNSPYGHFPSYKLRTIILKVHILNNKMLHFFNFFLKGR